jgi:hypothetical protein
VFIMVLDDNETYGRVEGCRIVHIPDELGEEEIEGVLKLSDRQAGYQPVETIDPSFLAILLDQTVDSIMRPILATIEARSDWTEKEIVALFNEIEDGYPSAIYEQFVGPMIDRIEAALAAREEGNEVDPRGDLDG